MKYTINVTQWHIDAGQPLNGHSCPIALALKEQLPKGRWDIWVIPSRGPSDLDDSWAVFLYDEPKQPYFAEPLRLPLPTSAGHLAACFDGNQPVQPISFELEIP